MDFSPITGAIDGAVVATAVLGIMGTVAVGYAALKAGSMVMSGLKRG